MPVLMSLGRNSSGDGFLLAPLATTYEVEIALWTDARNAAVTLQADLMRNTAGLVFLQTTVKAREKYTRMNPPQKQFSLNRVASKNQIPITSVERGETWLRSNNRRLM